MVKALVICGFVMMGAFAFGQQGSPGQGKAAGVSASGITVKGCVEGVGPGHFTLLQASTGAVFEMQGTQDFAHANGKLVEVKATELAPAKQSGMKSWPQLKVSQVRVVADQCPIQGNGRAVQSVGPNGTRRNEPPLAATPRYQRSGAPDQTPPAAGINPNGAGTSGTPSAGTGNPTK